MMLYIQASSFTFSSFAYLVVDPPTNVSFIYWNYGYCFYQILLLRRLLAYFSKPFWFQSLTEGSNDLLSLQNDYVKCIQTNTSRPRVIHVHLLKTKAYGACYRRSTGQEHIKICYITISDMSVTSSHFFSTHIHDVTWFGLARRGQKNLQRFRLCLADAKFCILSNCWETPDHLPALLRVFYFSWTPGKDKNINTFQIT